MILLYRIISTIIYPFLILLTIFRIFLKKEHKIRFKEKIFPKYFNVTKKGNSELIWFHAASIGEFKSIIPIIDEINKNYKDIQILITTVTLSSANLAANELKRFNNIQHRFFPLDIKFLIERFLDTWKPRVIFLVDSEIWPNLILSSKIKNIPLCVINARITNKSFKRWMLFPKTSKKIFNSINLFLASNLETTNFLKKLNVRNTVYNGNIKLLSQVNKKDLENNNKDILLKKKFWIAASTHEGEENFCLQTHINLKEKFNDIITIIFPRHINRVFKIKKLSESLNLKTQLLNEDETFLKDKEIIIVNSFGELQKYFYYAKSVFMGKSILRGLKNVGGQNPIEAVKLGCKIYHGPYVYNFKEIYEILAKKLISVQIENPSELSSNLIMDFENNIKNKNNILREIDEVGKEVLNNTMKHINNLLNNEFQ